MTRNEASWLTAKDREVYTKIGREAAIKAHTQNLTKDDAERLKAEYGSKEGLYETAYNHAEAFFYSVRGMRQYTRIKEYRKAVRLIVESHGFDYEKLGKTQFAEIVYFTDALYKSNKKGVIAAENDIEILERVIVQEIADAYANYYAELYKELTS